MKRIIVLCLLAIMLCGCGNHAPSAETTAPNDGITLWVITEETAWDGMNGQAKALKEQFEETHNNVSIRLDILPAEKSERDAKLEQLRTEIMAGEGPDGYLLPVQITGMESLFSDVELCMHNGCFTDISDYYDADVSLDTNALVTTVMEAGIVDDARYVLPLRFEIPVLYADTQALDVYKLKIDTISDINSLMETVLNQGNPLWAAGAIPSVAYSNIVTKMYVNVDTDGDGMGDTMQEVDTADIPQSEAVPYRGIGLSYLSEIIDYENGDILLTVEELENFMLQFQSLVALRGSTQAPSVANISSYIVNGTSLGIEYPIVNSLLSRALDITAISKSECREVTMIPLRSTDGDLVANITYYAAVGSGSEHVELTYEFLRLFLTEESQWEQNRPSGKRESSIGLIENGWPVRVEGSVEYLWDTYREKHANLVSQNEGSNSRKQRIKSQNLTDSDIPILTTEIDRARFQIPYEWVIFGEKMTLLNDAEHEYVPLDVNIYAAAEEMIGKLAWHLAEG